MGQQFLKENKKYKQETELYGEPLKDGFQADAKSHVIYFKKRYDKIIVKFSCKTKNPITAYRYASLELKKRLKAPETKKKYRLLFEDAIEKFLKEKMKAVESGEIKLGSYRGVENSFKYIKEHFSFQFVDIMELEDWPDKWDDFTTWFNDKYSGQTLFNVVKYTRSLSIFLHERGDLTKLPKIINRFAKKEQMQAKKKRQRILTVGEAEALLKTARVQSLKDYLIVALGYYMAFRISDCCELEWSRVHLDKDDPFISFEGGDKAKTFVKNPMPEVLRQALMVHKEESPKSKWVFPRPSDKTLPIRAQHYDYLTIKNRAEINFGSFHTLRHTRLSRDFGNPNIPDTTVMLTRRVSLQVALEHYIHLNKDNRENVRNNSYKDDTSV